jgi:hypothetical protein
MGNSVLSTQTPLSSLLTNGKSILFLIDLWEPQLIIDSASPPHKLQICSTVKQWGDFLFSGNLTNGESGRYPPMEKRGTPSSHTTSQ